MKDHNGRSEVADSFYELASFTESRRQKAALHIANATVENAGELLNYCVDRLVSGLLSTRAAARSGCALTLALMCRLHKLNFSDLLSKLVETGKEFPQHTQDVGKLLLCTAIASNASSQETAPIVAELKSLSESTVSLATSASSLLANIRKRTNSSAEAVDSDLKDRISDNSPRILLAVLRALPDKQSELGTKLSWWSPSQRTLALKDSHFADIQTLLKTCEPCVAITLCAEFLRLSSAEKFVEVYEKVCVQWATSGTQEERRSRAVCRLWDVVEASLDLFIGPHQLVHIFSPSVVEQYGNLAEGNHPFARAARFRTEAFLRHLNDWLKERESALVGKTAHSLLERLDALASAAHSNLEQLNTSRQFLLARLDESILKSYVQTAFTSNKLKVVSPEVFRSWPPSQQQTALISLLQSDPSAHRLTAAGRWIESLFFVHVNDRRVVARIDEDARRILSSVTETIVGRQIVAAAAADLRVEGLNDALLVSWCCVSLWAEAVDENEKSVYKGMASELLTVSQKISAGDGEAVSVLIDLLVEILSQTANFHKPLVYYLFVSSLPIMRGSHFKNLFELLEQSDNEILGVAGAESDDDDDDDGNAEKNGNDAMDAAENGASDNDEELESDTSSVASSLSDESLASDKPIDTALVARLRAVLEAPAAKRAKREDESTGEQSDFDDETMLRLDDALAAAFRSSRGSSGQGRRELAQQATALRNKVFDLLLLATVSENTDDKVKLGFLVPLVSSAVVLSRRGRTGESLVAKAIRIIKVITSTKKMSVKSKLITSTLAQLREASVSVTQPDLQAAIERAASFLLSISTSQEIQDEFNKLLFDWLQEEKATVLEELATAAPRHHPRLFLSSIPQLVEIGVNESIRPYKRTKSLLLASTLLQVLASSPSDAKDATLGSSAAKAMGKTLATFLSGFQPEKAKARHFGALVRLLSSVASALPADSKRAFGQQTLGSLVSLAENEELWKTNAKFLDAAKSACGSPVLSTLRKTVSSLETQ